MSSVFVPLRKSRRAAVLVLPWLLAVPLAAEDWPQWRGPNRDGVWAETGIMESFPEEGLKVLWRASVSWGYSSPVVAGGRVFVTDSQLMRPTARERVHCFEAATGKPLWTFGYEVTYPDWAFVSGQEVGPTATPIVEAGRVYTLGAYGLLHCLDARKGELLWAQDLGKEYRVDEMNCRPSPLIEGNLLIVFAGGKAGHGFCVVALDKTSGKEVWKGLDESVTNSSPLAITAGGKRQLIVWTQESVTSLAPETGNTYWRQRLLTNDDYVVSTPVFHGDRLLIGGLMLQLSADEPAASVLWPKTRAVSRRILSHTSTALFRSDHLYSARSFGELVCLEASSGKQVWETDKVTDLKNGASIHLTAAGGSVLLFTDKGELILARLTPEGYHEISRARLLEPTTPFGGRNVAWTPPAYANRHVFARSDREVLCASLTHPQSAIDGYRNLRFPPKPENFDKGWQDRVALEFEIINHADLESLRANLKDGDPFVRSMASRALGIRGDKSSADALAELAQNDPEFMVRIRAVESLGLLKMKREVIEAVKSDRQAGVSWAADLAADQLRSDQDFAAQIRSAFAVGIDREEMGTAKVGEPAPDFTAQTLDGNLFKLSSILGKKPLAIYFAAFDQ